MRLRLPEGFQNTLAFQLTVWYSAILVLGFVFISIISYLSVFASIRDNRAEIKQELSKYVAIAEDGGIEAIKTRSVSQARPSRRSSFFVRLVGTDNTTLFLSNPQLWEHFDLTRPQDQLIAGQWHYYTSRRDGDLIEVASTRLRDHKLLQVGKGIQDRNDALEHFRDTLLATTIPMALIGFAGGAFLAHRALRPIRNLSEVARSIIDTGRFDSRVPASKGSNEINDLVVLFNRMLQKIEVLIEGMKEALDNVAHDLRTPVARLRGVAEAALRSEGNDESRREALADCLEESERVMSTLNTLMDVSEAESGAMKLSLEKVNVGVLIAEVLEIYEHVADDKGITVATHAPEDLNLIADHARLRQVLANLVDNAVKYTPAGGRIDIEASSRKSHAVLLVKDSGIGIPCHEKSRIWERLYRGDESRSQRGLGLGLNLVKAVVQAHHGRVEAAPNPGGGSVFSVYLPLLPSA
jgi:signal transduction histidine kinase